MSETKEEIKKQKYVVLSKFARFKVGETIELTDPCPAAAQAHVRLFVEGENDSSEQKDSEAIEAMKRLHELVTGEKAGRKGITKLEEAIVTAFEESNKEIEDLKALVNDEDDE